MKRLIVMLLVMLLLAQPALAEKDDSLLRRPWGITAEQMLEAEKAEGLERTYTFKTMYVFEDIPFFGETATLIYSFIDDRLSFIVYGFENSEQILQKIRDQLTHMYREANYTDEYTMIDLLKEADGLRNIQIKNVPKQAWVLPDNQTLLITLDGRGPYHVIIIDSSLLGSPLQPEQEEELFPVDPAPEDLMKVRYDLDENGRAIITGGHGDGRYLIIPEEIDGNQVVGIKPFAFNDRKSIVSVSMPDTLLTIGENAFRDCTSLKAIKLSQNLKEIGFSAFNRCSSLMEVEIPASVEKMASSAFYDCSSLSSAVFLGEQCEMGESVFSGCTNLEKAVLPRI